MRLVTALLLASLLAGCGRAVGDGPAGSADPAHPSGAGPGRWTALPAPPLSPREAPVAAMVDGEAVFVGGYGGPPCPATAACRYGEPGERRDGAAWNPSTGTWRRIADAPVSVPLWAPSAVIGTQLYVLTGDGLVAWDSRQDAWRRLRTPPEARDGGLLADGDRLVLPSWSDENGVGPDHVLDTSTGRWSTLPADPLEPSYDRFLTATPHGLVLTAKPIAPGGRLADPALVHAAILPPGEEEWRVLPTSDQLGGWRWSWTGERLVDPTPGGADGGEVDNFGRTIPYGGALDPAAGTWSRLPNAPEEHTGGWPVEALGGPLLAAEGWLYDDRSSTWTRLPQPAGGPAEPGTATWVGEHLVVLGGTDWGGSGGVRSTGAWVLHAEA
ncbi:hypothetical protein [Nocardioides sp. SYSU DS0663]|uniref:hypothetical protein n=1 Tax=Nocardioides sp. SYSU DS0663 TaxID=3416445 RepID=UPI003F4B0B32